ncbi:MAG: hypothetical protein HAW64_01970, partial [Alphaproteobacteria bacterium]|nr:hypothetical protein [Alphaproteobacteria bacterium]
MKSFKKFIEETKLAEKTEFRATAWSNGGDGYGLRVSKNDRDNFFKKSEKKVRLSFSDKNDSISIDITSSFWNNCTELRSAEIK